MQRRRQLNGRTTPGTSHQAPEVPTPMLQWAAVTFLIPCMLGCMGRLHKKCSLLQMVTMVVVVVVMQLLLMLVMLMTMAVAHSASTALAHTALANG